MQFIVVVDVNESHLISHQLEEVRLEKFIEEVEKNVSKCI